MELKFEFDDSTGELNASSNRTFMELKFCNTENTRSRV